MQSYLDIPTPLPCRLSSICRACLDRRGRDSSAESAGMSEVDGVAVGDKGSQDLCRELLMLSSKSMSVHSPTGNPFKLFSSAIEGSDISRSCASEAHVDSRPQRLAMAKFRNVAREL